MNSKKWYEIIDLPWRENYADLSTGIRMYYMTLGPGDGKPVMLIHGGLDTRLCWSYVAVKLASVGYRVYVPELRGHGRSDKPVTATGYYNIEDFAEDICALFETLCLTGVQLAGHSVGSLVAQLVAARHPDWISSLTLLGSGTHSDAFEHIFTPAELDEQWRRDWAAITVEDKPMQEAMIAYALQADPVDWCRMLNGIRQFNSSGEVGKIICPVQIIWGTLDHCFTKENQLELKAGLSSAPYIRFVEMVGRGHCPNWESLADNDELYRLIKSFIE